MQMMIHKQVEQNLIFQTENKVMMKLDNLHNQNLILKYKEMLIKLWLIIIKNMFIQKKKKQKDKKE